MINQPKKLFIQRAFFSILVFFPSLAFAGINFGGIGSLFGGGDAISAGLDGLINLLTSKWAKLFFILSVVGVGYATVGLGKIPKQRAIAIVIGMGMVFSPAFIAKQMGMG